MTRTALSTIGFSGLRRPGVVVRASAALGVVVLLAGCAARNPQPVAVDQSEAQLRGVIDAGVTEVSRTAPPPAGIDSTPRRDPRTNINYAVLGFAAINGWARDDHAAALASFQRSCVRLLGLRDTRLVGGLTTTVADWRGVCTAAQNVPAGQERAFFERNFTPVRIAPGDTAHFTGYYEPELEARRQPGGGYVFPIYSRPPELQSRSGDWGHVVNGQFRPYFSRAEVYAGALNGRGLEIAYLNDAVELFFLQIQGSGRLRFPNGSSVRVGYAARNGYPFRSAGREMIRRGLSRSGSKGELQRYTRQNLQAGLELLSHNQSYVFFREISTLDPSLGPEGALGVQLTPLRSIAVDRQFQPLGAPVWVEGAAGGGRVSQLMIAQDTGSAILGPQRADIFWGSGDQAGQLAGRTNGDGLLTTLMPNSAVARLVGAGS